MLFRVAVANQVAKQEGGDLKLEIEVANQVFSVYGFSFFDLTKCSPRASKTKSSCAKAVNFMLQNPLLVKELLKISLLLMRVLLSKFIVLEWNELK